MMSSTTVESKNYVSQHFCGDFKLTGLGIGKSLRLRTPPFYPMPNINIKYCFEMQYSHSELPYPGSYQKIPFKFIKLRLLVLCASGLPSAMKLNLVVNLNFTDGSSLYKYKLLTALTTDAMMSVVFEDYIISKEIDKECMLKLVNEECLIIKCKMQFYDHIHTPPAYYDELKSSIHLKNFVANFKTICEMGELNDITIKIGEKSLPAHKAVLAAHSPVFRNMLTHKFKESTANIITISDFTFEIFECFLKYMYSGEIEDKSWPNVRELYILADKYDISSLKLLSSEIIVSQISLETICSILDLAFCYNDEKVKEKAVGFAAAHIRELIPTREWKELIVRYPLAGYEAAVSYII